MADDIKYAPCILCARVNAHKVLARQDRGSEEGSDMYYFLACAGCGAVSMANIYNYGGDDEARYYPSPISRKPPDWLWKLRFLFGNSETPLGELLYEIYEAVQGKQHRLALMGIRAFFEQLMIAKVGYESQSFLLKECNIRTRIKRLATGTTRGGIPFGRGALYYLVSC